MTNGRSKSRFHGQVADDENHHFCGPQARCTSSSGILEPPDEAALLLRAGTVKTQVRNQFLSLPTSLPEGVLMRIQRISNGRTRDPTAYRILRGIQPVAACGLDDTSELFE
jgi:hypothetical protein